MANIITINSEITTVREDRTNWKLVNNNQVVGYAVHHWIEEGDYSEWGDWTISGAGDLFGRGKTLKEAYNNLHEVEIY